MRFVPILFALLLLAGPALAQYDLQPVAPVVACSDLTATDLTPIGGAGSIVTAVTETTSDGIAVCSVTGLLAPQVNFQVLLPMATWTQRYLQVGCGGLCGNISLRSGASAGCQVLNDGGFVMAATDMGHSGMGAKRGLDDAMRADFAHRAQHITALAAKALTQAFYGQTPAYSYFNGCSDALRARHPQIDTTNPDLRAFQAAGGKLILWHGLADPHIAPANTVALHRVMIATIRADTVVGFDRLYLIPGMAHCGGGRGPTEFDLLTPMLAWVETGTVPGAILTSTKAEVSTFGQPDGGDGGHGGMPPPADLGVAPLPDMTRPVWPWSETARYIGSGDLNVAASWTQGPDADFFTPYTPEN